MTTPGFDPIDVAKTRMSELVPLDRVGMSNIECPVVLEFLGQRWRVPARIDAYVSLDEAQKGIHMSRLFLAVEKYFGQESLTPKGLISLLEQFLKSHDGISKSASVRVSFQLPLQRPSLVSKHVGWRYYPVTLWASSGALLEVGSDLSITYSSTCPCSAALSRQLIQKRFEQDFKNSKKLDSADVLKWLGLESSIAGTPHGQRSEGRLRSTLMNSFGDLNFLIKTIEELEQAIATPVQSAVKREDEQEFARLNASNLMFAEDAVRKMDAVLPPLGFFRKYEIEACHFESLHPHDAVASIVRSLK